MDYGIITGSGAEKLESSGVAPLVAVAHGFTTVLPDQVREVCDSLQFAPNSIPARQVRGAVGDRDAMLMRWFTPADAIEQATADYPVAARSVQIRPHPANVRTDASGKSRKYENIQGQNLVIGVHPATPASWLMEPIEHLLIAEGAMKADSALTAYLRHHGATDKELSVTDKDDRMTATKRLRKLMERIPEAERMVIMSVVGVGTWHKNPEWNTFRISGEVLISYDGDVGTNPQVWKQAREMFDFIKNKGGQPMLVDLSDHEMEDGSKCGVDDFLAMGNTWEDLLATVGEANVLPERPEGADGDAKYRMNPKTRCFEEKISHKDDSGNEWVEWIPKVNLTARVVEVVERREVTAEEEESGNYAETVSAKDVDSDCIIEIEWKENDKEHVSRIEGPATLMATRPERWTDPRLDVGLGADVLGLPQWPPTVNGFLEAMKSYRRDEIEHTAAWTHMGWVPRKDSGTPVFLIGNQVISHDGFDPDAATCGVTESDLAGASNFGIDLPDSDEQVREDIQKMVEVYRACWSDPRNFAVVIAAAMRPAIPRPANVPLFYSGSSGSGKALPLDSEVITPEGTKKVGDLQVGDNLIAPDGTPTRLRWLSPVFEDEEIYELRLEDGRAVRMSGNHVARCHRAHHHDTPYPQAPQGAMGGDANTIEAIASMMQEDPNEVLASAVAAGVPSEVRRVRRSAIMGEFTTEDGVSIVRSPLTSDGVESLLWSVPEVVMAHEDITTHGEPSRWSVKVSQLAAMLDDGDDDLWFDTLNGPVRVVSADVVETVPSRCVQVEHPTGCFVHDEDLVSHNSFTSAAIMAFWQPTPGRWSDKHLPGSASDTLSATEIALSKTPIWVLDDLAPSSANPRAQAEKTEAVNQTIRNVHNGAGKRRATKDMGSQKTNTPRALLVVSAEAAPINDQSIMNRLVHVEVAPGFLVPEREPTDRLEGMNRSDTVASRITGRAIQMLARKMAEKGWRDTRNYWNDIFNDMSEDAHAYINDQRPDAASSAKRQSETIAEMLLGVQLFGDLCDDLGMDMQDTVGEMVEGLKSLALEGFSENLRFDLGNQFLSDIRMLLISQQVHVAALGTGGAPITVGEGGVENNSAANALNQFLGWKITGDPDRPYEARGDVIGYLVHTKNDDPVVLLTDAAFHIVQRKGTNRGGLNQKAAFEAMWKARIPVPEDEGWKRKPRSGDKLDYRVRVMNNGTAYAGVPVYLSKLMES